MMVEVDTSNRKQKFVPKQENKNSFQLVFDFPVGNDTYFKNMDYTINMGVEKTNNVNSYDVYINGYYFGTDIGEIPITTNDTLQVDIIRKDITKDSNILFVNRLV
jgi:hypothetical protein